MNVNIEFYSRMLLKPSVQTVQQSYELYQLAMYNICYVKKVYMYLMLLITSNKTILLNLKSTNVNNLLFILFFFFFFFGGGGGGEWGLQIKKVKIVMDNKVPDFSDLYIFLCKMANISFKKKKEKKLHTDTNIPQKQLLGVKIQALNWTYSIR